MRLARRSVIKSNTFNKEFKRLSHEAQKRCLAVIEVLATADDPLAIAYERMTTGSYVYRFGSYRLVYRLFGHDSIEILELLGVGHGHDAYR